MAGAEVLGDAEIDPSEDDRNGSEAVDAGKKRPAAAWEGEFVGSLTGDFEGRHDPSGAEECCGRDEVGVTQPVEQR